MKEDVELVHDSDRIRVLLENTRKNILELLKVDDMSISQIAEGLDKDRSTIYRHVKKLEEYGYVELKGEKVINNVPGMIYGRTAKLFLPCPKSMDPGDPITESLTWDEDHTLRILKSLKTLGYDFELSEELVEDLGEFFSNIDDKIIDILEDKGLVGMGFLETLRLKVLIILIEFCKNDEIHDEIEELIAHFEGLE
ncbi:MAG: winged helix-turn-helix domain-containing protein [Candidatus Saliniplasma sp.]